MEISTKALAILLSCVTFKPTAAEDNGLQLRGNQATKGRSQPAGRALNLFGDDAEGAVGKASTQMLMGRPLEGFLSDNVPFNDQKSTILRIAGESPTRHGNQIVVTGESEADVRSYLVSQVEAGRMDEHAAETVAMGLGVAELYASAPGANNIGPVDAVYNTAVFGDEGNMERVAESNTLNYYNIYPWDDSSEKHYNGVWGYSTGDREYALQCHGYGLAIIDVTSAYAFRVQLIAMPGGDKLRDVVTYKDPSTGKTYAYVGGQLSGGSISFDPTSLWVIDLSYLSGDQQHSLDSAPIPRQGIRIISHYNGAVHTINAYRGLLFLNAFENKACQVLDLTNNPIEPKKLFTLGFSCHDSYVRNIKGRDILFVSDGIDGSEILYDITDVDANTNEGSKPKILGRTDDSIKIMDHSSWLTEDNRYLFVCDENKLGKGIIVYDVKDLNKPKEITRFKTSLAATYDKTVPHNGMIRGNYYYVAYYGAGLRVFDISNPKLPVEVGKVETDRDPDGYGSPDSSFWPGLGKGAWNVYLGLPSGNILVNDMYNGLFVVRANRPYSNPSSPTVTAKRRPGKVQLDWNAVSNARGYSVERKRRRRNQWETIAEHLVEPSYLDTLDDSKGAYYRIKAINGEGIAYSQQKRVRAVRS